MSEEEIEKDTMEDQTLSNSDLDTLNVNVWFNRLESRLQFCLVKENAKEGFMQYKMLVKHAEILAISSKKINKEEYLEEVKQLKEKELKDSDSQEVKEMREAMLKYEVILTNMLKINKSDLNLSY